MVTGEWSEELDWINGNRHTMVILGNAEHCGMTMSQHRASRLACMSYIQEIKNL